MLELIIHGDVHTVLEGKIAKDNLVSISLEGIAYALGAGAFWHHDILRVGEAIVIEGKASIFVPQHDWSSENAILSPFLMGIERKPREQCPVRPQEKLNALYARLLKKYPAGFAIVGDVIFSQLETAFVKVSPIYGENINELSSKYWQQEQSANTQGIFFGVVLSHLENRAFYQNPNEPEQDPFFSHSHTLIHSSPRHLLTSSVLVEGRLWVEGLIDKI